MSARATFLADQLQAASDDAVRVLHRIADEEHMTCDLRRPTPWVAQLVDYVTRGHRTCRHLRDGASPAVTVLQAHRRRVECTTCAGRSAQRVRGTIEDRRCDVCRHVIEPEKVQTAAYVVGPIIVTIGHCGACTAVVQGERVAA